MTPCPPRERLHFLLTEQLPPDEESRIAAHVESCPVCVRLLDELTSIPALPSTIFYVADTPGPTTVEFDRLRALLPHRTTAPLAVEAPALPRIPGYTILREIGRGGMGV